MLHLPAALGLSSGLLRTRPADRCRRVVQKHGGDLTLDIQFESAVEFDYQGLGVHISGVRG